MAQTPLIIGVPTANGMGLMTSVLALAGLHTVLERPVAFVQGEGGNIPRARNQVLQTIQANLGPNPVDILWWDTDIRVADDQIPAVASMIRYGVDHQVSVSADYHMSTGETHLMKGNRTPGAGVHYSAEELAAMADWAPVGMAGFGLLFIPQMPVDYVFRADNVGEDVHWWWDHPDWPLVVAKSVIIHHRKAIWI